MRGSHFGRKRLIRRTEIYKRGDSVCNWWFNPFSKRGHPQVGKQSENGITQKIGGFDETCSGFMIAKLVQRTPSLLCFVAHITRVFTGFIYQLSAGRGPTLKLN